MTLELRHGPDSYGRQQSGIFCNGRKLVYDCICIRCIQEVVLVIMLFCKLYWLLCYSVNPHCPGHTVA